MHYHKKKYFQGGGGVSERAKMEPQTIDYMSCLFTKATS